MYLAFAQHVNARQLPLRGMGQYPAMPTVSELVAQGMSETDAENLVINAVAAQYGQQSDLPVNWPTTGVLALPTGGQGLPMPTAPVSSQQWMKSQMIPGVNNSYLIVGVAGLFLFSALKKKKR